MDAKQLTTFKMLCEEKNFTHTAQKLNYAQSSVSAQIQQLEEELGTKLFERINRSVILTKEGEDFYQYTCKILSLLNDARQSLKTVGNRIVIAAAESLVSTMLPAILKKYKTNNPDTEITIQLADCKDYIPVLDNSTADILFSIGKPLASPNINTLFTYEENISIYASPEFYPKLVRKQLDPSELNDLPFLLTGQDCEYRAAFLKLMKNNHVTINPVMEAGSIQAIIQAASCGLGLCVLPDTASTEHIKSGILVPLDYKMDLGIVSQISCHKDKWIFPALEAFIKYCT